MPRPKSDTPSYCLHKRSGRGYVTLDGRQCWLPGLHGSAESRAGYDRLLAEWLQGGRTLPAAQTSVTGHTVSVVALAFWRHAQAHYVRADGSPTGEAENYRHALRALRRLYGDTSAAAFGPKQLKVLRSTMTTDRREVDPTTGATSAKPGWSRTYANRQVKRVQQVFRWAASEELVPAAVAAALGMVAGVRRGSAGVRETDPVGPVPDEAVDATLPFLPPPVRAMVQLQRLAGTRGGELFALRACDLDTTGPVWKYRPSSHKTAHHGKGRVVRFGPQAQDVLRPFLRPDLQGYLFRPADALAWRNERQAKNRRTPLTPSRAAKAARAKIRAVGEQYTKNTYAQAIARACDAASPLPADLARGKVATTKVDGRKHQRWETAGEWRARLGERCPAVAKWQAEHRWHPHQLRHAAATALRRDADFESAKIILGHSSDSMTAHYAERDERKADDVMARLG
jgi:integrase